MAVNIHIYQSDFKFESRILRITKTLSNLNYFDSIYIFAVYSEGLSEYEEIGDSRYVYRVKTLLHSNSKSIFRYIFLLEWAIRILIKIRKLEVSAVNPHSAPTLPIGYLIKKWKKAKLIYDTHEIESEQYVGWSLAKIFSKILEWIFVKTVDIIFTTSDGYSAWYQNKYPLNDVVTVKNYPISRKHNENEHQVLKDYCKCKPNDILFIYQGIISEGRGIELLINIFKKANADKHVVFMGYGDLVEYVKEIANNTNNIHFHPAVKSFEVFNYVRSCDVGFCLIEPMHLSYYHTLPNKMLECMNANVPVIVSNFPDMTKSINEFDTGWSIEVDEVKILELINSITKDDILIKKSNTIKWAEKNTWESQELIIKENYNKLLNI